MIRAILVVEAADDGLPELPMNSGSLLPDDTGGRDVAVRAAAPAIVSVSLLVAYGPAASSSATSGSLWVAGEISSFTRAPLPGTATST